MYDITIRARIDVAEFPYELTNIELTELAIESAIGTILEKLFSSIDMKEVTITPSSYDITIRVRIDATEFPYELTNIELTELAVESAVGITLEKLFPSIDMREVTITPSSRERELDLDSLLS